MIEELIKLRKSLEIISGQNYGVLRNFPNGCCGYVSHLIGTYLEQNNYGDFDYIESQKKSSLDSHAWLLSKNGDIIDLTADQFGLKPIIYTKNVHPLSGQFPIQKNKGSANIFKGAPYDNSYYIDYQKILQILE